MVRAVNAMRAVAPKDGGIMAAPVSAASSVRTGLTPGSGNISTASPRSARFFR
jgi:hypothetical protein